MYQAGLFLLQMMGMLSLTKVVVLSNLLFAFIYLFLLISSFQEFLSKLSACLEVILTLQFKSSQQIQTELPSLHCRLLPAQMRFLHAFLDDQTRINCTCTHILEIIRCVNARLASYLSLFLLLGKELFMELNQISYFERLF